MVLCVCKREAGNIIFDRHFLPVGVSGFHLKRFGLVLNGDKRQQIFIKCNKIFDTHFDLHGVRAGRERKTHKVMIIPIGDDLAGCNIIKRSGDLFRGIVDRQSGLQLTCCSSPEVRPAGRCCNGGA